VDDLIRSAQRGDENGFQQLMSRYSREILLHCYKMLGSYHDAEDVFQEASLNAWRNIRQFSARGTFRSWLYKIATNLCLHEFRKKKQRPLPTQLFEAASDFHALPPPLTDTAWFEPIPEKVYLDPARQHEQNDSVKIAFLVSLQVLTPEQRAVLILRDILDFSGKETAEMLDASQASVTSSLQRARARLSREMNQLPQDAHTPEQPSPEVRDTLDKFLGCWEQHDVDGLVSLLKQDAEFSMPPFQLWFKGRDKIREFLAQVVFPQNLKLVPIKANDQFAFAGYAYSQEKGEYVPQHILVLSLGPDLAISSLISFLFPHLFPLFGLPEQLA